MVRADGYVRLSADGMPCRPLRDFANAVLCIENYSDTPPPVDLMTRAGLAREVLPRIRRPAQPGSGF